MKIGTTPYLKITANNLIVETEIAEIVFTIGRNGIVVLTKTYPTDNIERNGNTFSIPLTQNETLALKEGNYSIEGQINYASGAVAKTNIALFKVDCTLATKEWQGGNNAVYLLTSTITLEVESVIKVNSGGVIKETDPIYTADKPLLATKDEITIIDKDQKEIVIEKTFDSVADIAAWVFYNEARIRQGTILRTLNDDPDFIANWDGEKYLAIPLPNIHATKIDYSDTQTIKEKIDELELKINTQAETLSVAIIQSRQQAEAYALKLVNEYADSYLYFQNTGIMSPTKPIGLQKKAVRLTTTETIIDTQTFTITEAGTLKHNAIYSFKYILDLVSSSRDTTIKLRYTANDILLAEIIAQYRGGSYIDLSDIEVVSLINADILYDTANVKVEVFARTSSNTDDIEIIYNDGIEFSGVKREIIVV